MRLNEFADLKDYVPTAIDAEDFLNEILLIWPDRSADELAPSVLRNRRQPPAKPRQLFGTPSIGSHIAGAHHRDRRRANQWPAA
jgi:hypothetical protein